MILSVQDNHVICLLTLRLWNRGFAAYSSLSADYSYILDSHSFVNTFRISDLPLLDFVSLSMFSLIYINIFLLYFPEFIKQIKATRISCFWFYIKYFDSFVVRNGHSTILLKIDLDVWPLLPKRCLCFLWEEVSRLFFQIISIVSKIYAATLLK